MVFVFLKKKKKKFSSILLCDYFNSLLSEIQGVFRHKGVSNYKTQSVQTRPWRNAVLFTDDLGKWAL